MGDLARVKRRLLSEAVADNLDTIRGIGPWSLQRRRVQNRRWSRLALALAIPVTFFGAGYLISVSGTADALPASVPLQVAVANVAAQRNAVASETSMVTTPVPSDAKFAAPQPFDAAALPLEIRHIVLDAGHGGSDPGTVSGNDVREKDITLDIERRLRELLVAASFKVTATRDGDSLIPLKHRAHIANTSKADLFVSIHINSIRGSQRGVQTYYLGPTDDPVLTQLAAAENRGSGYSLADMKKLLEGIYADVRQDESKQLAENVQKALHANLRTVNPYIENWGVRKAPFVVLVATEMPAILAEVSCLSNQQEANLLRSAAYRQKIAEALFQGIRAYAETHNVEQQKGTRS